MTVDRTKLRIVAVGNSRPGYRGVVQIDDVQRPDETWEHDCGHVHESTAEARNCIRRHIRDLLTERSA